MPPKASTSSSHASPASTKLALPAFLKLLTSPPKTRGVAPLTLKQAMSAASILVPKGYTSLSTLSKLSQVDMAEMGIADEDIRKGVMALTGKLEGKKVKRKKGSDLDRPLPDREERVVVRTDFDFEEIQFEEALLSKSVVTNRAPVMTAWATVVAERLGFRRQEALSLAQVYTDMNASSKGVSLGIYEAKANDPHGGPAQPFVELMGRKVPVLSMQDGEWRAIAKGAVAEPAAAFAYVQKGFYQQMGAVIGSMQLLADSFSPDEVNQVGYQLYCEFRPEVDGWGKKGEMKCSEILGLRKKKKSAAAGGGEKSEDGARVVKVEDEDGVAVLGEDGEVEGRESKKKRRREEGEDVKPDVEEKGGEEDFDALLEDDLDLSELA
ncbi:hypothetical protein MNV49_006262 [Pseudohyphozyma bogoriensis]|nr:hypothetical protein MNV49_006262 [Pseudohyphozyma bogoriensis]